MSSINDVAEFLTKSDKLTYMKFLAVVNDDYLGSIISHEVIAKSMDNLLDKSFIIDKGFIDTKCITESALKKEIYENLKALETNDRDEFEAVLESYDEYNEKQ